MSTLHPLRSAISLPFGSMACSAVVADMLAEPTTIRAKLFMRVVSSNIAFI